MNYLEYRVIIRYDSFLMSHNSDNRRYNFNPKYDLRKYSLIDTNGEVIIDTDDKNIFNIKLNLNGFKIDFKRGGITAYEGIPGSLTNLRQREYFAKKL